MIVSNDRHRELVRRLAADLAPTRPLLPVSLRLVLWGLLTASILASVMSRAGHRIAPKLSQPLFVAEILFFGAAAAISAGSALRSAVPGRTVTLREAALPALLALAGTTILLVAQPINSSISLGDFVLIGWPCAVKTALLGALPWFALWWLVGRGASMSGARSGLMVGAGALLSAFAMMRVACPVDEPLHLLAWHLLPALLIVALSILGGAAWLQFRLPTGRTTRVD